MEKANQDIRNEAKTANIPLWRIGEALTLSEPTMIRRLRHELTGEEKNRIRAIISELQIQEGTNERAENRQ